jgi:glycosyltransferase involved in cell wall biosynthesis
MRVALVGPFPLHPERYSGGVETSTAYLLEGLRRFNDMDLHLVSLTSELHQAVHIEHAGVQFHHLPAPARLNVLTLYHRARTTLARFLHELEPDLVHAQEALGFGYTCVKAVPEIPTVVSIHGVVREDAKHASGARAHLRGTLAARLIQRSCVKNARFLIQPTRYPEEYFGSLITGKIFDTGNAIADSFFALRSTSEPGRILYSGVIRPLKRLLDLVQAISLVKQTLPHVMLRIAGPIADSEYHRVLERTISKNGVESNVVLLGPLTMEQRLDEYRRSSLLVLPSAQETSPLVIGEAMAVGLPVVATRVGGVPYLVDDQETGFVVDVGDVQALATRTLMILRDADLRNRMGRRAKQRAERFRSSVVATKVRNVYCEAISSG